MVFCFLSKPQFDAIEPGGQIIEVEDCSAPAIFRSSTLNQRLSFSGGRRYSCRRWPAPCIFPPTPAHPCCAKRNQRLSMGMIPRNCRYRHPERFHRSYRVRGSADLFVAIQQEIKLILRNSTERLVEADLVFFERTPPPAGIHWHPRSSPSGTMPPSLRISR